jgi:hypothetical protein
MSQPYRPGPFARFLAGCVMRSCLVIMVLLVFAPLLLFLGGGAFGIYQSIRNAPAADAFRATPQCTAVQMAGLSHCYVLAPGSIGWVTWSPSRSPIVRQDVILRLSDGERPVHVDVWVWQLGDLRSQAQVEARLDEGKVTELTLAGGQTFETTDSPVAASTTPQDVAVGFLVLALIVAVVMFAAGRKELPGLLGNAWQLIRIPSSPSADVAPQSSLSVAPESLAPSGLQSVDEQTLLALYASAPQVDSSDPNRQVIPLSKNQRLYGIGVGALLLACALAGVLYLQTVLVEFIAAGLALSGIVLLWWAGSWKLILTATGFEVVGMVTRKRRRWMDVSGFDVDISVARRGTREVVHFRDSPSFVVGTMETKGKWRWILGALGNSFSPRGMSAQEQVKLLEEWRQRYSPP